MWKSYLRFLVTMNPESSSLSPQMNPTFPDLHNFSHSTSAPVSPSARRRSYSPILPSPVSPIHAHAELPLEGTQSDTLDVEDHTGLSASPAVMLSPFRAYSNAHMLSPIIIPSPRSAVSSADLVAPSSSGTDLMEQEFHHTSVGFTPISPQRSPGFPRHSPLISPHEHLCSLSLRPSSAPCSPPSATALSLPMNNVATHQIARTNCVQTPLKQCQTIPTEAAGLRPRHPLFYMQDEMIILDVDGSLYRVHRYHLEHGSEYFRRLLRSCTSEDNTAGKTDETAIAVTEVTQGDFDCLLNFLYYKVYELDTVPLNDWITLLRVSTRLRFLNIRECAVGQISTQLASLSAVEIIDLAIKYDIPEWLAPAYADLCCRPHPLDDYEAEQLGARITARIGRAREEVRDETFRMFQQRRYGNRYSLPETYDEELVSRIIMQVFRL
ncbi:hypothetical protein AcV7_002197 [Taiwanofungus camphoratus]|nr:hypothetical protein AcV7_002197 [Antrodia cinnamomea]